MTSLATIQKEMFAQEDRMLEMAEVFGALSSDCRLEIIYLLLRVDALPSWEIGRLTNCTPSQVSQYLAKMHQAGIVEKRRNWREVEYSLCRESPFVEKLLLFLSSYMR